LTAGAVERSKRDVRAGVAKRVGVGVVVVVFERGGKGEAERLLVSVSAGTGKLSRRDVREGVAKRVGAGVVGKGFSILVDVLSKSNPIQIK